jgi:hypothetical protein
METDRHSRRRWLRLESQRALNQVERNRQVVYLPLFPSFLPFRPPVVFYKDNTRKVAQVIAVHVGVLGLRKMGNGKNVIIGLLMLC